MNSTIKSTKKNTCKSLSWAVFLIAIFISANVLALGDNEACDTITPDEILSGWHNPITVTTGSRKGCWAGHIVSLVPFAKHDLYWVKYGSVSPTTRSKCESLRIAVVGWEVDDYISPRDTTYLGQKWLWGKWDIPTASCIVPKLELREFLNVELLESSDFIRLGVTARQYVKPKNPRSGFWYRKITLSGSHEPF